MAVIYKGGHNIKGVVRHGETVNAPPAPQTVDLGMFENGSTLNEDLLSYFSRAYESYTQTMGEEQVVDGVLTSTVSGGPNDFKREFVFVASDQNGTETITFTYTITPVHGLEADYTVDFNLFTATFAPKWVGGSTLYFISTSGNPSDSPFAFNEQLILAGEQEEDGPIQKKNYAWSGTLPTGLSLSATGLVTGALSATKETDFGTHDITISNTHGATATLQLNIKVNVLS